MTRREPSEKMKIARKLRLDLWPTTKIAKLMGITRQGVCYLLRKSDKFHELKIGTYKDFVNYKRTTTSARK